MRPPPREEGRITTQSVPVLVQHCTYRNPENGELQTREKLRAAEIHINSSVLAKVTQNQLDWSLNYVKPVRKISQIFDE